MSFAPAPEHSPVPLHCTQNPFAVSHVRASSGHDELDVHFCTQVFVIGSHASMLGQSAVEPHWTQRWSATSQRGNPGVVQCASMVHATHAPVTVSQCRAGTMQSVSLVQREESTTTSRLESTSSGAEPSVRPPKRNSALQPTQIAAKKSTAPRGDMP